MATRILIIEDNKENLNLMSYLLQMYGYQVLEAVDGEIGLSFCKNEQIDLILCDIQLPKIDGYEIIRICKAKNSTIRDIPLIAITAYAMVGDRDRILQAGCNGYVSKPIVPESFVSLIESYLPPHKQIPRLEVAHIEDLIQMKQPSPGTIRGNVLIVDDNPADQYLSEMLINSIGFDVMLASSVNQALELIANKKPDLILSDFHLPDKNGLEFFNSIKLNEDLNKIPFIMISSSILHEQRTSLIEKKDNIAAFIIRPVEPQVFIDIVEAVWKNPNGTHPPLPGEQSYD